MSLKSLSLFKLVAHRQKQKNFAKYYLMKYLDSRHFKFICEETRQSGFYVESKKFADKQNLP